MRLHNIRYGFATNSSSSHSVVLAPGLSDHGEGGLDFGWQDFILASPEAKRRYMFVAAKIHHEKSMSLAEAVVLARAAFPVSASDAQEASSDRFNAYIDHQSEPSFPEPRVKKLGMMPLWTFLDREIVQNQKIAILGGNDNQDNEEWKPAAAQCAPESAVYKDIIEASGCVYSIDPVSGHLTLFNRTTGKKVRVLPEKAGPPAFSVAPELVDIKITDYCPVGCSYCYQGSTKAGRHASLKEIRGFAAYIGAMGVFEVAIGGGDPTTHPEFVEILKAFHDNGVVPNFSTQLWDWLDKKEIADAVKSYCGAVALSTQNADHANKWIETCAKLEIKPHIHYVLGLSKLDNLKKLLRSRKSGHIVLLAYKEMGRATGTPPVDYTGWQDVVRKHSKGWTVAVDSFLVDEVRTGFTREEVPEHLFEKADGRFSLYWDAVEGSYAEHSFVPMDKRLHFGPCSDTKVAEAWERISGVPKAAPIYR